MTFNLLQRYSLSLLLLLLAFGFGCEREMDELEPATFPTNGDVFIDAFSAGLNYAAFGGSKPTAFDVDTEITYEGATSMRFGVPDFEDPAGAYAGGTFFLGSGRDLSGYTALTFWARASKAASIDVIGFGNDLDINVFQTAINGLEVNTNWQKYYIPIPDPAKLTQEKGMLFYSEGPENNRGYTFWIDQVQFEDLGTLVLREAVIFDGQNRTVTAEGGTTINIDAYSVFNMPTGVDQRIGTSPAYFDYTSSDPSVATVNAAGVIEVMAAGETLITATLNGEPATGSITVTSTGPISSPAQAAPTPGFPAADVVSVYSDDYNNIPVDFYNGFWQFSTTNNTFPTIQGNEVIRYTDLNFVGIQFTSPTVDVSEMTNFQMNVWTSLPTGTPVQFKILLADFGPDNAFGGGDDSSHELTLTSPTLVTDQWFTIDIPLSDFTGLTSRQNLAQIVLSGDLPTIFTDNILFYR